MAEGVERRLAAVLFSDIKGYSRQMDADEEGALARLEVHDAIFRDQIEQHGGTVIKTVGDAFMVEFASAVAAVKCGLQVQRALAAHNEAAPEEQPILVRIGIHVGDVVVRDGDLFGETVNVAARLEPEAPPGGLCISQAVYNQVRRKVHAAGEPLGPRELKNIGEPVVLYALRPAAEHLDLHAHDEEAPAPPADEPPPERGSPLGAFLIAAVVVGLGVAAFSALNAGAPGSAQRPPDAAATAGRDAAATPATGPRRGGTLRVAMPVKASRFDLFSPVTSLSRSAMGNVVEAGVSIDAHGEITGGVLERWTLSPDARRVDLYVREGVWLHANPCLQDGKARPLTAADLVYSLHQALREEAALPVEGVDAYRAGTAEAIAGIEVAGERQVSIRMSRPTPFAAVSLTHVQIVPAGLDGCDDLRSLRHPVGTGPFRFAAPPTGTSYRMERAPDYWRRGEDGAALPYVDALEYHSYEDPVEVVSLLARGELDAVVMSPTTARAVVEGVDGDTPRLKARFAATGLKVAATYVRNQSALAGLMFFLKQPRPQTAPKVRAAIAHAVDRQAIAAALDGLVKPASRIIEARFTGHDPALRGPERDLAAARRLLEEAGHGGGAGLPELKVAVFESTEKAGQALRAQLAEVGLTVRLATITEAAFDEVIKSGELDAVMVNVFGRTTGSEPHPFVPFLIQLLRDNGFEDAELARQMDELATRARPQDRAAVYASVERRLLEALPIVPLGFQDRRRPGLIFLLRPSVRGLIDPATGRIRHFAGPMAAYTWLAGE